MSDVIISLVRTYVPLAVGGGLSWAATRLGIADFDSSGVEAAAVLFVSAAYYALARLLERKWPVFRFLLGVPRQPGY